MRGKFNRPYARRINTEPPSREELSAEIRRQLEMNERLWKENQALKAENRRLRGGRAKTA